MRKSAGFTLIELLIGLVVLAILLATAIPAFRTFVQNNRLDAEANEFVAAAQLARAEAIKRGVDVTICSSSNGTSCGGGFSDGWIVIVDPADPDTLIQRWPAPGIDVAFATTDDRAVFAPTGFLRTNPEFEMTMTPVGCAPQQKKREITAELTGRVASLRVDCP